MIEVASRPFREQGVAAVGLAGIMAEAGLTNGAFYAHFDSKEDLVREALSSAGFHNKLSKAAGPGAGVEGAIRDYLSPSHRDNPGRGCPTSALVAEMAHQPRATRNTFTDKVAGVIELIAAGLRAGTAVGRRRKAVAIYGLMVGTLQLARAVNDSKLSGRYPAKWRRSARSQLCIRVHAPPWLSGLSYFSSWPPDVLAERPVR